MSGCCPKPTNQPTNHGGDRCGRGSSRQSSISYLTGASSGSFPRPEGVTWEDRGVPRSPADAAPLLGCSHGPIRTKMWDPPGQLGYPSSRSAGRSSPIIGRAPAPPSVEVAQFAALVFGHLSRPRSGGVTASRGGATGGGSGRSGRLGPAWRVLGAC